MTSSWKQLLMPYVDDVSALTHPDGRAYIPEPPMERKIHDMYFSGIDHFLYFGYCSFIFGLISIISTKFDKVKKFFPCYHCCKPRVFEDTIYELGFMSSLQRVFRSAHTTKYDAYINWLNKVEKKKEQFWKYQGIYELIELSRTDPKYNPNMLISTFFFWEGSTNTFHLCRGMMTLTLFDVGVVTSLRLTWDTFDPSLKNQTKPNFSLTRPGFSNYIEDQHKDHHEEVSDYKHIAFLTLAISFNILIWFSAESQKVHTFDNSNS